MTSQNGINWILSQPPNSKQDDFIEIWAYQEWDGTVVRKLVPDQRTNFVNSTQPVELSFVKGEIEHSTRNLFTYSSLFREISAGSAVWIWN